MKIEQFLELYHGMIDEPLNLFLWHMTSNQSKKKVLCINVSTTLNKEKKKKLNKGNILSHGLLITFT